MKKRSSIDRSWHEENEFTFLEESPYSLILSRATGQRTDRSTISRTGYVAFLRSKKRDPIFGSLKG
ncbi:MAG: hypothetical protein OEW84_07000 [Aigarchaeota archaeon]|nr:hypothetical protein [Aigarchaeota archaeon]